MTQIRLSWRACQVLEQIARSEPNARMVRRAQALLWLHAGESIASIAQRLSLSRPAIYKIVARWEARADQPVAERVRDDPHPGRPATKRARGVPVVSGLLHTPPARYGYRAFAWTTPMLRRRVERRLRQAVSERTIRRALRDLRYRYKRPRYVLARRSATWGQAKGGSSEA